MKILIKRQEQSALYIFPHRFQQLLHLFLRHLRGTDILTRHLREGTVVVFFQQFRELFFYQSFMYF